ncbi:MAG: NADPH-dependent FMN reductase [Hyphomicrobiales bacterium]
MDDTLNILAITGSLRKESYNTKLLRTIKDMGPKAGLQVEIATLHGIPLYDGDDEAKSGIPASVLELVGKVRVADGVIIATPEYNFSIPGVLKNATDWVSRPKDQPFKHKPVGIVGASGGPLGTGRAQYHLRQNLQGLEALPMPKPEVFVGSAPQKFDDAGKLTDEATIKVIELWLKSFADWVRRGKA